MELAYKSILELKELIDSGTVTSQEVWSYFYTRTQKLDPKLKSFLSLHEDGCNTQQGPLVGIPLGVKDIFCETGRKTTGASNMLKNFVPPYDATVITRLKEAGMSSLGKCNMDEFAMGSSGENSAFQITQNPHGTNRIPGGSSSGSAACVAAGLVPASL